jgi:hypothetical protein
MPQLHSLTDEGILRFQEFLDSYSTDHPESFDGDLLVDKRFAVPVGEDCEIPTTCEFDIRFDAAENLATILRIARIPDPSNERGIWCWLSWFWFESLCPKGRGGKRNPGELARWILNSSYDRYYRHLLAGPWFIYDRHNDYPERARALLCNEVATPGELVGQVAAYQELVSNASLVQMLSNLFYDPEKKKLRRGIGGKGPGSARRLVTVLEQLATIWDLHAATPEEIKDLLPAEFDRYKRQF